MMKQLSGSRISAAEPGHAVQRCAVAAALVCGIATPALADESQADLAKKLNNPISDLISLPIQVNYDQNLGPTDSGERVLVNVQPVIPISLNDDWNVISRTILPLIDVQDIVPGSSESGVGDVVQSLFFSPKAPTASGWIWGVGPVLLLPTASDDVLGTEKWGAGPTAVALKQQNGWTYGMLANHISSFAGEGDRTDVEASFLQPFLAFTTPTFTTFSLNTESTYDWEAEKWSVPINAVVTQLFRIGKQPMSLQAGVRYWAESPVGGAEGWGWRLTYTLVLPK